MFSQVRIAMINLFLGRIILMSFLKIKWDNSAFPNITVFFSKTSPNCLTSSHRKNRYLADSFYNSLFSGGKQPNKAEEILLFCRFSHLPFLSSFSLFIFPLPVSMEDSLHTALLPETRAWNC